MNAIQIRGVTKSFSCVIAGNDLSLDIPQGSIKQMVEIKSGFTTGATTPVVEAVAARLNHFCTVQSPRGANISKPPSYRSKAS